MPHTSIEKYVVELEQKNKELKEALRGITDIIDQAGLLNLSSGVQLGSTVWYVKASDRMEYAKSVLENEAHTEE